MIAKAVMPRVKVAAVDAPMASKGKRFGFLAGQLHVPDDFDRMGTQEIQALFDGRACAAAGYAPAALGGAG